MNVITEETISKIKIVIWDLDETLWKGTIDDGDKIAIPKDNIDFVNELTNRGIVNSICSKNDISLVKDTLKKNNLLDLFVFISADWTSKGPRVKELLSKIGLRAANALFIDDNHLNLEEVSYYNSGIMVCSPNDIPSIFEWIRSSDLKIDSTHKRLYQYKVLEKKDEERKSYISNRDFLLSCNIMVDINYDCINEIDRIHELIMRSNQLNFTKKRSTREELEKTLKSQNSKCGTVHAKDRFGDYGMVGFFAIVNNECEHFLFSCRTIGMGIENYVYHLLGKPKLISVGEVIGNLESDESNEWINVSKKSNGINEISTLSLSKHSVLFKGPCDLEQIFNYIEKGDIIDTEFTFIEKENGVSIQGAQHSTHIVESITLDENEKSLIERLPFGSKDFFTTKIFHNNYKYIFLSTLHESHLCVYRNKSNGSKVVFGEAAYPLTRNSNIQKYLTGEVYTGNCKFNESDISSFSKDWESDGIISPDEFKQNILFILNHINPKAKLVLLLGSEVKCNINKNHAFDNTHLVFQKNNRMLEELSKENERIICIKYDDFITGQEDFNENNYHFQQIVYYRMAKEIENILGKQVKTVSRFVYRCKMLIKKIKSELSKCYHRIFKRK